MEIPPLREVSKNHFAACHLAGKEIEARN